ncbi:glycosyltransferase [Bacillus sp. AFS031507]|uniref:glycosyltransferase n=1 Tax=Bacillus sp. AFS031507 TaxID=2033496 RepID=UPI000BFBF994|nr:glycosyltransferase [Bacillus sp. AFS031507]PGY12666.1 hypothetical protein COE25_09900 [Bacillus sp. AFS031507]
MEYKVGVCICTFKRPSSLSRLLESLMNVFCEYEFTTIIIDNDKSGSAKVIFENYKNKLNLIYELEEKQGLSNARNKCIEEARELNLDYIAFLDDDEIVYKSDWLSKLLETSIKYTSQIVTGPILPLYHSEVKEYIKKTNYFTPPRYKHGEKLAHTGTGNTLIKLSILNDMKTVFSDDFNLSGGEDTYLFINLVSKGYTITWCDEAEVQEFIPLERAKISYIFKRSFYSSVNYIKIEFATNNLNKKKKLLFRLLKGSLKIIKGLCLSTLFIFAGIHKFIQGLSIIGNGLGDIAGIFGVKSKLYKS